MIKPQDYMKYIFVIFFVFVIYLAYIVVRPFTTAILTSAVLAYIFYPFYRALNRRIGRKNLSAFIVSLLIILLLTVPLLFLLNSVTKESQFVYVRAKQIFVTGDIFNIGCAPDDVGMTCKFSNWLGGIVGRPSVRYHLEDSIKKTTTSVSQSISNFVFSIPTIVLNIFVTFFITFYLFKDGKDTIERAKRMLPLKLPHQKQLFQQLDEVTYAIIYGSLLVAVIQGGVGAIGYYLFGISSPLMWGMLTAILALLPFIGTALVWLPLSLFLVVQGVSMSSSATVLKGIGLLIYGALIVSSMDNVLKPYVVGRRARIHPVLVLLGVLGGLAFFGFIGFVIGPLILAIFATFLEIYEKEKQEGDGLRFGQ